MTDSGTCCMIIDAQPVVRLGVRHALDPAWDFEELPDGRGSVGLLNSVGNIELAVVEMRAAKRGIPSAASTLKELREHRPTIGLIAYGNRDDRHVVKGALEAGANAYVCKHSDPATIRRATETVLAEGEFVDPRVQGNGDGLGITPRQRQVLQLFADGHSTGETARRLGLSAETVRTHAKAALPRLGARDRAHAVATALRSSVID